MAPSPADDDPFEMFGDDDEDEDEVVETEASRIARSLVETANHRITGHEHEATPASTAAPSGHDNGGSGKSSPQKQLVDDVLSLNELMLPWRNALYVCETIELVSSLPYGGGRGYVSKQDISPGTLVLVEQPILSWPLEQQSSMKLDLISAIRSILESTDAEQIVRELEHLHPTKAAVDGDEESDDRQVASMMERLNAQYRDDSQLELLVDLAERLCVKNSNGSLVNETDVLRILLVLRYNALESGVYLHVAMLNHADQPNCVKFLPTSSDKNYSEVRTTRPLRAGEALTISYVPSILSHASRRKHLFEQHRFDIGAELPSSLRKMELIDGKLPPSAIERWDENSTTQRIEMAAAELRQMYMEAESLVKNTHSFPSEASEQIKALEVAALELYTEALEQLKNKHHLLLIPCLELHLDCADLAQRDHSLSASQRMMLLGRLVVTARRLLVLQESFHGPDHFDLARTSLDLAQAAEELLSKSTKHLLELDLNGLETVSAWSALESTARRKYTRIQSLYPHDEEKYISK